MTSHTETLHGLGLMAAPRRLMHAVAARAAERRSLAQLKKLDDRLLRDIGLTRADVIDMTHGL